MAASIPMRLVAQYGRRNASLLTTGCCSNRIAQSNFHVSNTAHDSDTVVPSMISPEAKTIPKAEKISRAMRAYLERGKAYDAMISKEVEEYEIGKRYLARIMGDDPDSFSQEDIDRSIEYLLPSGLFNKGARPKMKHPSEVFPPQKSVQFDRTGRPFHSLFYTGMPNYYQIMHDASVKYENLRDLEDAMRLKGITVPLESEVLVELKKTTWVTLEKLREIVLEKLDEHELRRFQVLMERLSQHPLAHKEREFIMRFRKPLISQGTFNIAPVILKDEDGREYTEFVGRRKDAEAKVKLWVKGSGKILVNGSSYQTYFPRSLDREQLLFPLQFVGRVGSVDVEATVARGGPSGQAGAVRHGLSHCLTAFIDSDTVERMRIVGLLTRDVRRRERKKPGQPKARKKHTWKKR